MGCRGVSGRSALLWGSVAVGAWHNTFAKPTHSHDMERRAVDLAEGQRVGADQREPPDGADGAGCRVPSQGPLGAGNPLQALPCFPVNPNPL